MDLLFRGRVQGFGIMSSDSDFMPLATRIRQDGLPVYGFGTAKTPQGFRQACSRFIDVAALEQANGSDTAPAPAAEPTQDAPLTDALPPAIGTKSPAAKKTKPPVDQELLKLLIDAYDASKRDEKGYVSLSAMGQLAANRSSFDVRNYGFKRLSDLVESVPNFQIERRDGRALVKRLR